jgi:DNA replication and repair protein RecF
LRDYSRRWAIYISHLSLTNFRNYSQQELDLEPQAMVLHGDNAQGKTNFLEAIYVLAMGKSHRASLERELINWSPAGEGNSVTRLVAQVRKNSGDLRVEMAISAPPLASDTRVQKRIKINGVPRRAVDLVGQLNVVLFSSRDIDLVAGTPSQRRRYLDVANSQVNPKYLHALQQYNKVLLQRNHLLRLIGERRADEGQLDFWDRELIEHGSYIIGERRFMIEELNVLGRPIHYEISAGEDLKITYMPNVDTDNFQDRSRSVRREEIARGMSLVGPHRDDMEFTVGGVDMGVYGSRGQQRTVALSMRLAEARYLNAKVNDKPVLLLDDVLSELDEMRRHHLLDSIESYQQVVFTTTDLGQFAPGFITKAMILKVSAGSIAPSIQSKS